MNGIDPPSPHATAGLPKNVRDARSSAWSSHGSLLGVAQPPAPFSESNFTRAPYGGSDSNSVFNLRSRSVASRVGGRRIDNFRAVIGRNTFPPWRRSGMPA